MFYLNSGGLLIDIPHDRVEARKDGLVAEGLLQKAVDQAHREEKWGMRLRAGCFLETQLLKIIWPSLYLENRVGILQLLDLILQFFHCELLYLTRSQAMQSFNPGSTFYAQFLKKKMRL